MIQPDARRLSGIWAHLAHAGYALFLIILVGLTVVGMPAFLAEQSRGYINVDLGQNAQGEVVMMPTTGYEADQAGIKAGDVCLQSTGHSSRPVPRRIRPRS